jgi:chemotaxis protein methyltransferase CheR
MKRSDFDFVRDVVRAESGVVLGADKEYLVESRLAPVVRQHEMDGLEALIARVRAGAAEHRAQVVDALTTHETYFFRDVHPFDALRTKIIPDLLAERPQRRLTMWSAAAATGQEPYSLAMMLQEHFSSVPVSIVATDLSRSCVEVGRRGSYSQMEINRGLPARLLVRYFDRDGLRWCVQDRVRAMVSFRELNLVRPWPALPPMDVILLRNVLTYFDLDTRREVLRRAAAALRPGGVLFLGGSETTIGSDPGLVWTRIGKTVCYRKGVAPDG